MRAAVLAMLVAGMAAAVVHAPVVLGRASWDHATYQGGVVAPRLAAAAAVQGGRWPSWWEGSGFGVPLSAEPRHAALYPPSWLADGGWAADLVALLHLMLLGVALAGLVAAAHRRASGRSAALASSHDALGAGGRAAVATLAAVSGVGVAALLGGQLASLGWLTVALWLAVRWRSSAEESSARRTSSAQQRPNRSRWLEVMQSIAPIAGSLAAAALAGAPGIALLAALLVALELGWRSPRRLAFALLATALGGLAAAAQLVPWWHLATAGETASSAVRSASSASPLVASAIARTSGAGAAPALGEMAGWIHGLPPPALLASLGPLLTLALVSRAWRWLLSAAVLACWAALIAWGGAPWASGAPGGASLRAHQLAAALALEPHPALALFSVAAVLVLAAAALGVARLASLPALRRRVALAVAPWAIAVGLMGHTGAALGAIAVAVLALWLGRWPRDPRARRWHRVAPALSLSLAGGAVITSQSWRARDSLDELPAWLSSARLPASLAAAAQRGAPLRVFCPPPVLLRSGTGSPFDSRSPSIGSPDEERRPRRHGASLFHDLSGGGRVLRDPGAALFLPGAAGRGWTCAHSRDRARAALEDELWRRGAGLGGRVLRRASIALAIVPSSTVLAAGFQELGQRDGWSLIFTPTRPLAAVYAAIYPAGDATHALAAALPEPGRAGASTHQLVVEDAVPFTASAPAPARHGVPSSPELASSPSSAPEGAAPTGSPDGGGALHAHGGAGPSQDDESTAPPPPPARAEPAPEPCTLHRWRPGDIELTCATPAVAAAPSAAPFVAAVASAHAAGWRATVDGVPRPALRVEGVLRGVALSAGEHQVRWRYQPPGFRLGAMGSLVGLGLLAALGVLAICAIVAARRRAAPSLARPPS